MARRSRRSRHLGAMQSDQTANILIGVGAVVGIGTLAYYFMRKPDETTSETESSTYTEPGSAAATQSTQQTWTQQSSAWAPSASTQSMYTSAAAALPLSTYTSIQTQPGYQPKGPKKDDVVGTNYMV